MIRLTVKLQAFQMSTVGYICVYAVFLHFTEITEQQVISSTTSGFRFSVFLLNPLKKRVFLRLDIVIQK